MHTAYIKNRKGCQSATAFALGNPIPVGNPFILQIVPIIDIPGFGDRAAEKVCAELKIQSQNDTKKLDEAKKMVYLKGFVEGVMSVGKYAGEKVDQSLILQSKSIDITSSSPAQKMESSEVHVHHISMSVSTLCNTKLLQGGLQKCKISAMMWPALRRSVSARISTEQICWMKGKASFTASLQRRSLADQGTSVW